MRNEIKKVAKMFNGFGLCANSNEDTKEVNAYLETKGHNIEQFKVFVKNEGFEIVVERNVEELGRRTVGNVDEVKEVLAYRIMENK